VHATGTASKARTLNGQLAALVVKEIRALFVSPIAYAGVDVVGSGVSGYSSPSVPCSSASRRLVQQLLPGGAAADPAGDVVTMRQSPRNAARHLESALTAPVARAQMLWRSSRPNGG